MISVLDHVTPKLAVIGKTDLGAPPFVPLSGVDVNFAGCSDVSHDDLLFAFGGADASCSSLSFSRRPFRSDDMIRLNSANKQDLLECEGPSSRCGHSGVVLCFGMRRGCRRCAPLDIILTSSIVAFCARSAQRNFSSIKSKLRNYHNVIEPISFTKQLQICHGAHLTYLRQKMRN